MNGTPILLAGLSLALASCQPPDRADGSSQAAVDQVTEAATAVVEVAAAGIEWADLDVPGFAPGMKIAALAGNSSEADRPYTIRLLLPDGYAFPAHWHPRAENVSVLTGTMYLAIGEEEDQSKVKRYEVGDYLYIPAKLAHYGRAEGETVLQLHGIGPFDIIVVEKAAASSGYSRPRG